MIDVDDYMPRHPLCPCPTVQIKRGPLAGALLIVRRPGCPSHECQHWLLRARLDRHARIVAAIDREIESWRGPSTTPEGSFVFVP